MINYIFLFEFDMGTYPYLGHVPELYTLFLLSFITLLATAYFFPRGNSPPLKNHSYGHILEILTILPQTCIKLRVACKRTGS